MQPKGRGFESPWAHKMKEFKTLGLIENITIISNNNEKNEVLAKIDTGASMSSIDIELAEKFGINKAIGTKKVKSASGTGVRPIIKAKIIIRGIEIESDMTLANRGHMKYSVLIGSDVMKKYNFKVNPKKKMEQMPKNLSLGSYKAALMSLGSLSSIWTVEEMSKYFKEVDNLDIRYVEVKLDPKKPEILYKGNPIKDYDCVYLKGSFRFAQVAEAITRGLYQKTYLPIHPESFNIVHDKLNTHLVLQENKIPMPTTYFASSSHAAEKILKRINYPIILKFPKGTQGKGVLFADSYITAKTILDALTTLNQPFIIQEFIESAGEDIRIIVAGDQIIASMKRKAQLGEIRSNIHAGGIGMNYIPNPATRSIAIRTAKILRAEICGVDILQSAKGPLVIEANISPGLQGITKATNINVAHKIAKYLFERTKYIKENQKNSDTTKIFEDIGIQHVEEKEKKASILYNLEMRGERILLPGLVSKISEFMEGEEIMITTEKGKIEILKQ